MNEKIKLLALQAGFAYEPTKDQLWVDGPTEIMISPGLEKFAELIVKECDTLCQQYAKQRDDKMSGIMSDPTEQIVARKMGTMIKEHFGVEE